MAAKQELFWDGVRYLVTASQHKAFYELSDAAREVWIRDFKLHKETLKMATIVPAPANSVESTLAERGSRYGDFTDHAEIAQDLQDAMRAHTNNGSTVAGWHKLSNVQRQALTVIADKIARILSGDPNYADNWHDLQGYAKLVEDRLPKEIK